MPGSEREYRYWDRRASTYDRGVSNVLGRAIYSDTERWLLEQFTNVDTVLEMGCGSGLASEAVAGRVKHLIATDFAPGMIDLARDRLSKCPNVTVQTEDCYGTSFDNAVFDAVLMANLIHVVEDPLAVMAESYRLLKDGGRAVVIDATAYGMPFAAKIQLMFRAWRNWGMPCASGRNLSPNGLANIARLAGFRVGECELIGQTVKAVCLIGVKARHAASSQD